MVLPSIRSITEALMPHRRLPDEDRPVLTPMGLSDLAPAAVSFNTDLERGPDEGGEPATSNPLERNLSASPSDSERSDTSISTLVGSIDADVHLHPTTPIPSKCPSPRPLSITVPTPDIASELQVGEYTGRELQESPVCGIARIGLHRKEDSFASQTSSTRSSTLGLEEKAAELLRKAGERGLCWGLPSETGIWDKPAGWQQVQENEIAPPDHPGPFSGVWRFRDEHDEHRHLIGLKRLGQQSWSQHTTQDGAPYFVNHEMQCMTDDYIRDQRRFERLQRWASRLYDIIKAQQATNCPEELWWPTEYELYLCVVDDLEFEDGICYYYFVDYGMRQVFWLHSLDLSKVFKLHERASSTSIELCLKSEFWSHLSLYPHSKYFPADAEHDVTERLKWSYFDTAVSRGSTSPYSHAQADDFLGLLDRCKDERRQSRVKRAIIARLMVTYLRTDRQTRFGELGARIDRADQPSVPSVDPLNDRLTPFRRLCYASAHVLLFGTDVPHLTMIRSISVDDCIPQAQWQTHIAKFLKHTEQSNLIATLFLTGNIGFLALQYLGEDPSVTTVISTILSLASLMIGLHHVRQHESLADTFADIGARYFWDAKQSWLSYRGLALFYCLPWGLLVWSIIWFTLSLFLWVYTSLCTSPWCYALTVSFGLAILFVVVGTLHFSWVLWKGKNPRCRVWDGFTNIVDRICHGVLDLISRPPSSE